MIRSARQEAIGWLARRWPQRLYCAVGHLARVSAPLARRRATVRCIQSLFPHLGEAGAQRVARDLRCSVLRSRALGVALARSRGRPVLPPVTIEPSLRAVRGPAILTTSHVGPVGALGALLRGMPGEVVVLHRMEWPLPSNVVGLYVAKDGVAPAAALYRAVVALRRGGCVLILGDGPGHRVALLGGTATFTRGPYALARLTNAPIIPLLARWNGATIDVVRGETIAASGDEVAMAQAMAAVLERHLLEHPAQIGGYLLEQFSRAPRPAASRAVP
jgi:lauroyl/myristoyl acyltransferase